MGIGAVPVKATFFDYLFYLLKGMPEFIPDRGMIFKLPIRWFLFQICYLVGILYYPQRDLQNSIGMTVIVKGESRKAWWMSKCIWSVLYILAVYAIVYIVIGCHCLVKGEILGLYFTSWLAEEYMGVYLLAGVSEKRLLLYFFIVPVAVSISMSIFELLIGTLTKPIIGFLLTVFYLLLSSYKLSPFLLGNYMMGVRSSFFIENGVMAEMGIGLSLWSMCLFIFIGRVFFRKKDILSMSEL